MFQETKKEVSCKGSFDLALEISASFPPHSIGYKQVTEPALIQRGNYSKAWIQGILFIESLLWILVAILLLIPSLPRLQDHLEEAKEIKEGKLPVLSTRSNRWTMLMWDGEYKQYQRREQDLTKKASGRRKRLLKKMTSPASELSLEGWGWQSRQLEGKEWAIPEVTPSLLPHLDHAWTRPSHLHIPQCRHVAQAWAPSSSWLPAPHQAHEPV